MQNITKAFTSFIFLLIFLTPGLAEDTVPPKAPSKENVVATVNGKDITLGHVLAIAGRLPDQYMGIDDKDLFAGIVDQLVQQELLMSLIKDESTELQLTLENEKRALYANEALQMVYFEALSEEAIRDQYDTFYAKADPIPEYHASHILLDVEEDAAEVGKLLAEGADFAETAKIYSTGPSGPNGGDLGWAGLGQFVPEFEAAMVKLKPGQISDPVKTQFGWHLIKLNEIRNRPVPELDAVRAEIEDRIKAAALERKISQLETSGEIKRNDKEFDPSVVRQFELLQN